MSTPLGSGTTKTRDKKRRINLGKYMKRVSRVFRRGKSGKSDSSARALSIVQVERQQQPTKDEVTKKEVSVEEVASKQTTIEETLPAAPAITQAVPPTTQTVPTTTTAIPPPTAFTPVTQRIDRTVMQQERARALCAKYGLTLDSHELISVPVSTASVQRVERPIRMRVHRCCHHCGTMYGAEKTCKGCEHKRCKKCPRYPDTKPSSGTDKGKEEDMEMAEKPRQRRALTTTTRSGNERTYNRPRQRVRRTCHKCDALFIPPTATTCDNCRHIRCTKCPRDPAKPSKWANGYPGDVAADSDSEVETQPDRSRRTWRKPRMRVRWECEQCQTLFLDGQTECSGCGHERCINCIRSPPKTVKTDQNFDVDVVVAVETKLRALVVDESPLASEK